MVLQLRDGRRVKTAPRQLAGITHVVSQLLFLLSVFKKEAGCTAGGRFSMAPRVRPSHHSRRPPLCTCTEMLPASTRQHTHLISAQWCCIGCICEAFARAALPPCLSPWLESLCDRFFSAGLYGALCTTEAVAQRQRVWARAPARRVSWGCKHSALVYALTWMTNATPHVARGQVLSVEA